MPGGWGKNDHKWIFWSLALHWYQKQSLLRTIFAARGSRIKSIIDGKLIGKKLKIWKFLAKPMLFTSKESLEHVEFRFRCKTIDLFEKIIFFQVFDFFSKGGTLWCWNIKFLFFNFSKFAKTNLKNGFNGT